MRDHARVRDLLHEHARKRAQRVIALLEGLSGGTPAARGYAVRGDGGPGGRGGRTETPQKGFSAQKEAFRRRKYAAWHNRALPVAEEKLFWALKFFGRYTRGWDREC